MTDTRNAGATAVALATAVIPMCQAAADHRDNAAAYADPRMIQASADIDAILEGLSATELVSAITVLAGITGALAIRLSPTDPTRLLRTAGRIVAKYDD